MERQAWLRKIPKTDDVLHQIKTIDDMQTFNEDFIKAEVRQVLQELREAILTGEYSEDHPQNLSIQQIIKSVQERCQQISALQLRRVINGTGVVLHTNLGRAPLGNYVKEALWDVAQGYSNLEMNLTTGKRGSRYDHMKEILLRLTGAEDVLVVNNNAGAVLLVLSAIAKGKEVIISRGELVEIGGSFRVPEVMEQSGATLIEVGATNKTYVRDYEKAVTEHTGALLKVHQSNFKIVGFTQEASVEELVSLAHSHDLPLINDLGSGLLIDLEVDGFPAEPTVQQAIEAGSDVVTFSGDKLLGGAQAGIIAGKREWIRLIEKHPLTRALRVDKLTLCALEATLVQYLDPIQAKKHIPALKMMTESVQNLQQRAKDLYDQLQSVNNDDSGIQIDIIPGSSQVGGGSYPTVQMESRLIRFSSSLENIPRLERFLRSQSPAIVGRIQDNALLLDLRTIFQQDYNDICQAFLAWITLQNQE
ncbi:L-seryl-tRNA(Sec) selenium transferase [Anoxynatronum buryatiense]|uniref:L-seryl-tRNA(Sec) selenium transferase n=1 Tax=Anoxynatronum buryatiense TaxID=489973 RepID=A0AA45WUR9_9CLOT|nr:L-seryl-tRNA(Sec) selenium transferase [Anoxynatronum buryatiense]SMP49510.1 L-seryl-tRNA(Sec) selenium transferase [Anoxynatronum buryatiense]